MASVAKVPVGLTFYAQACIGNIDPTERLSLTPASVTPGPFGISRFSDPAVLSLRDLAYLMLTISDNAATDAVTHAVGIDAVNHQLQTLGCTSTVVVSDLATMLDGVAADLGFGNYNELLAAQRGDLGPEARGASTDPARIDRCRALDPAVATRTTARDATRLLAAIWHDAAGPAEACATLRSVMAEQVTRRLGPAVPDGGTLAAKSGGLFGRVRNEIGVVTDPDGTVYAISLLTHAHEPFKHQDDINRVMATTAAAALNELREQPAPRPRTTPTRHE